ncbi:hypothetical protein [Ornithobacterium rhinotracheale]|uniref:hypothetical protein n=1 Tax=Ornithobacterium rhinotracheale TaxID=28251 RepID=UPI001FF1972F|nr:hypothetical protein [Ornithobacterium rhinotracheale]MCK0199116.1 hypothetical protein [Ornithobacterium rhinotracheale]
MKKISIENKELKLYEGGADGFIGVRYDSKELDIENPFFKNNGLEKEIKITKITIDLENEEILTEKIISSITPTGDNVDVRVLPVFKTSKEDTKKFMQQAFPLLVPAGLNGVTRQMGVTRAVMDLRGALIMEQPIAIPEDEE